MARNTDPSWATIQRVRDRDQGMCVLCHRPAVHTHHRRPRGMGGSRWYGINLASNLLSLCEVHHDYIESHRQWALANGLLVSQHHDPATVPVKLLRHGWVGLLPEGGMEKILWMEGKDRACPGVTL